MSKEIFIQSIEAGLKRSQNETKILGFVGLVLTLLFGGLSIMALTSDNLSQDVLYSCIIGLVILFSGTIGIFLLYKNTASKNKELVNILKEQPGEIIWVYQIVKMTYGKASQKQVVLCFKSGKKLMTLYRPKENTEGLIRLAQEIFPGAVIGYRDEWLPIYKKDPGQFNKLVK